MCKGPVVVRIMAGARVKEGWCDWGHGWDGQDKRERKDRMPLDAAAEWAGKQGRNETRFLISGTMGFG